MRPENVKERINVASRLARLGLRCAPKLARRVRRFTGGVLARFGPQLVDIARGSASTVVTVGSTGSSDQAPRLVMVGRRDAAERAWELQRVEDSWLVEVPDSDLGAFAKQLTDVLVERPGGHMGRRRRLVVRSGLPEELHDRSPVVWALTISRGLVAKPLPKEESTRRAAAEWIRASGAFDETFYRQQHPDLPAEADPIRHYVAEGAEEGSWPSPMFDPQHYRRAYPDTTTMNPFLHYCRFGWLELRNPSAEFDTWWYWAKHMNLADASVNPLEHYRREGAACGLSTRPDPHLCQSLSAGQTLPSDGTARRICMVAGFDADGIVDDYVVAYVRELSRFADVYYMADSEMGEGELDKLSPYVCGAWAERHGETDFGSYRRLVARVGWPVVEGYDELLFVNDSGYLLRPLDDVFEKMDARQTDWWGLQAAIKLPERARFVEPNTWPVPLDSVRSALLDELEAGASVGFHIGSDFLGFRRPVIRDLEFRRYLDSAVRRGMRTAVIEKRKVGLSSWLLRHGHRFDTFLDAVYPYHPLYTDWYFRTIEAGYPLLKRSLLTANPLKTPALWTWKERVQRVVPDADLATVEAHLGRTTDSRDRQQTLSRGTQRGMVDTAPPPKLLTPAQFKAADETSPKFDWWWAFPVCGFTEDFSGNERAVFEEVKNDPRIRKVVFIREQEVDVDGVNVDVVRLNSPEGQHLLMRCGVILIKHSIKRNVVHPVSPAFHNIIQVWHGIPYKRIGFASEDFLDRLDWATKEDSAYRAVIASSRLDAAAMASAFYPRTVHQAWTTGLPRNDFILRPEEQLPTCMREELARLRGIVGDRRLILYMPTFRNTQEAGTYQFSAQELAWWGDWLEKNNAVLGVREHLADRAQAYRSQFERLPMIDLSARHFADPEILYRKSCALITDYSSAFIDYMILGRPAVSFAYDYDSYQRERGGFYELESVFPGPIAKSFSELQEALAGVFDRDIDDVYRFKRSLLFDHVDDKAASRVVERIKELDGIGTWAGERAPQTRATGGW